MKGNIHLKEKKKAEVIPPRVEEPKLVPTAEAKGFPNPAPKGAWVPKAQRESICFTSLNVFAISLISETKVTALCLHASVKLQSCSLYPCLSRLKYVVKTWKEFNKYQVQRT